MIMRNYKAAIISAAVTIVCLIPFVNKAFHIDDTLFIWAAKQIQTHPADFYGFSVNWYGINMPMAEVTKNPPLACYYIALAAALFGWSEIALHIAFLVPAALAALGVYYLAGKFCSRPIQASLAAVLTPGFLVSSTNIMCDTMTLAFWVWAVFLWMEGIEKNKNLSLFFAAVLAAFCALTKYFGITLLPLLLAYSIMQKRRPGVWTLLLLVPIAILAWYQWVTHSLYGRGWVLDVATYAIENGGTRISTLFLKGLIGLCFTGGCIITALFYSPLLWSRRVLIGGIGLVILFVFIGFAAKIVPDTDGIKWASLVQAGLMAATGVSILWLAGADFWKCRNAESLLLLLWIFGTFIFAGFINWTINARSILPMTPAVGIILMRRIEQYKDKSTKQAKQSKVRLAVWPLIPAAIVSLLVCWADYTLADTARCAAADICKSFERTGRTIWFQGHWGFQYYMEAAGGKAVDFKDVKFGPEDIIVVPSNNTNTMFFPKEAVSLGKILQFAPYRQLATMNRFLGAGFYANIWGPLPYAAGSVTPEQYYVFTLKPQQAQ